MIRFDVEDTGIGIAKEVQDRIFEPYVQADSSTTRKFGGTGLGLAITKKLTNALGGRITVKSELEKGSVFSLVIPVGIDIHSQPTLDKYESIEHCLPSPAKSQRYAGHVLVAEDNPANQMLISILLKKMGFEVTLANNGQEAVDKAAQQSFDLIFMDIQMPVLHGFDATRILHKKGITAPIIALTANAMKGDEKKCLEAGCDGYIAKPIEPKKLHETIRKFLSVQDVAASAAITAASPATSSNSSSAIVSELANDPDLYVVAEIFVENVPTMIKEINEAAKKADTNLLKQLAHTLKGASGSAGFPVLAEKAALIEHSILQNTIDTLKANVDELSMLCQNLSPRSENAIERKS